MTDQRPKLDPRRPGEAAAWLAVTAGGAGFAPKAPGTFGSFVGAALVIALAAAMPWPAAAAAAAAVASVGCLALGGWAERRLHDKDPSCFVLDEVAGVAVALCAAGFPGYAACAVGFIAFRFFDVVKPLGIARLQRLPAGLGILADDLAAGVLACAAMHAARLLL